MMKKSFLIGHIQRESKSSASKPLSWDLAAVWERGPDHSTVQLGTDDNAAKRHSDRTVSRCGKNLEGGNFNWIGTATKLLYGAMAIQTNCSRGSNSGKPIEHVWAIATATQKQRQKTTAHAKDKCISKIRLRLVFLCPKAFRISRRGHDGEC